MLFAGDDHPAIRPNQTGDEPQIPMTEIPIDGRKADGAT
jgi:hypothetical protein